MNPNLYVEAETATATKRNLLQLSGAVGERRWNDLMMQRKKYKTSEASRTEVDYNSQRALVQYIGVNSRPNICAVVQHIVPGRQVICDAIIASYGRLLVICRIHVTFAFVMSSGTSNRFESWLCQKNVSHTHPKRLSTLITPYSLRIITDELTLWIILLAGSTPCLAT